MTVGAIEIVRVRYHYQPDAYEVSGKLGGRERSVYVASTDLDRELEALGSTPSKTHRAIDLVGPIVALALKPLREAFRSYG